MTAGRVVGTLLSCTLVAGCAAVVVGMSRAATEPRADDAPAAVAAATGEADPRLGSLQDSVRPHRAERVTPAATVTATPTTVPPTAPPTTALPPTGLPPTTAAAPVAVPRGVVPASRPSTAGPAAPVVAAAPRVAPRTGTASAAPRTTAPRVTPRTTAPRVAPRTTAPRPAIVGQRLPLGYSTGTATRVITVTAGSSRSTTATLQAWTKVATGRWTRYGSAVRAYVGSDGIGSASETRSKTPAGSWTITQAFGRYADPGTSLPYVKTNPSDYWISSPGRLYNTRQRCGSCGYNNGVNERLYYVTPQYNYAAVIDYNTRNAPGGVKQGRGSAFFLHVAAGEPTAGCVAIPQSRLVSLLRWLAPKAHPRILIGVT